jgi:uncharacterized membrane protein (UPF0127 family)
MITHIKRRYSLLGAFTIIFACAAAAFIYYSFFAFSPVLGQAKSETKLRTIYIDGTALAVSVADTEAERNQGLSGRTNLDFNEGMLFVFDKEGQYSFWMHDMNFAIDALWVNAAGEVVHIAQNMTPESYPEAFTNDTPAQYVIEVPGDYVEAHNLHVGSRVTF